MTNLQIAKLYVAVNGTAPTAAELATLSASATTAADIMAMVDFTGADNTATLNAAYQAAFGRDADAEGLAYWGAELTAGNVTGATLMEKLLVGADVYVSAGDATIAALNTADKGITANKATVALEIATAGLTATEAATALALVTATDTAAASASVAAVVDAAAAAAQAEADAAAAVGATVVFTAAIDALTGTTGDDIFVGDVQLTSSAADQIAGSAGTDTVKLYTTGAITYPVMSSIESLYIKGANAEADVTALTDVTALELDTFNGLASGTESITLLSTQALTLSNSANAASDDFDVASTAVATHNVTFSKVGNDDTTTANADAIATMDFESASVTSVNLVSTGAATNVVTLENAAALLTTVNLTGDQKIVLDTSAMQATLTTIDASEATGAVILNMGTSVKNTTVTTGSGDDSVTDTSAVNTTVSLGAGNDTFITAAASNTLTVNDSVDGGEGIDTLSVDDAFTADYDDATPADVAVLASFTNFEKLQLNSTLAANFDISKLGFNYLKLADANAVTISGFASNDTIEFGTDFNGAQTGSVTVSMTGATNAGTSSDTLNLVLSADLDHTNGGAAAADNNTIKVDIAGINIINVDANDSNNIDAATTKVDGYTIDLDSTVGAADASLTSIAITGSSAVTYTSTATNDALETVNGSTSTGNLTINLTAFNGTQGNLITTGAGDDVITVANSVTNADIITTGAGADNVVFTAGDSTVAAMDSITDYDATATGDTITTVSALVDVTLATTDVKAAVTGATEITATLLNGFITLSGADVADVDTIAEFASAANIAIGANAEAVAFAFDGDTYVVENTGAGAIDNIVKLTGLTDISVLADTTNVDDAIFIA